MKFHKLIESRVHGLSVIAQTDDRHHDRTPVQACSTGTSDT